jgi:hypothetical protein
MISGTIQVPVAHAISPAQKIDGDAVATELHKMDKLVENGREILFTLHSIFPLDLFPTTISIERTKVNVVDQLFFGSHQVQSILVDEISVVELDSSILFSTLTIMSKVPYRSPITVKLLHKSEAARARRIIQGLMVSRMQHIDITNLPATELLPKLEQIGESHLEHVVS